MAEELITAGDRSRFLEAAWQIGIQLCRDAIWSGNRCNWLGDSTEFISNSWTVAHRSFGPDFYSGTAGIAFFLAHLNHLTEERIFRETAQGAFEQALSRREAFQGPTRVSFFSGLLGLAYVSVELGRLFKSEHWTEQGFCLAETLLTCEPDSSALDVISGSAGAIPIFLELHRQDPRDFLLDLARRHAENIVQSAQRQQTGWSWHNPAIPAQANLTGFSHGAAGIGCSLLEANRVLNDKQYLHGATEALRYERQWFVPTLENWLDLRTSQDRGTQQASANCSLAWCHGAPGIALSRLRAFELLDNSEYRTEADQALRTTANALANVSHVQDGNFSLCHGHFGNAEALLYAGQVLDPAYRSLAERVVGNAMDRQANEQKPWKCGVPNGDETPGLMLGLAGIGYFLLRLVDTANVPSVLLVRASLDPAKRN